MSYPWYMIVTLEMPVRTSKRCARVWVSLADVPVSDSPGRTPGLRWSDFKLLMAIPSLSPTADPSPAEPQSHWHWRLESAPDDHSRGSHNPITKLIQNVNLSEK